MTWERERFLKTGYHLVEGALTAPGVVLTPHIAGGSQEVAHKAARIAAAGVGRYLRGEPLVHCANPGVLRAG